MHLAAHLAANPGRPPLTHPQGEPFANAEQAWFWTMGALAARREGTGDGGAGGAALRPR
jgi:hypothetical protein